jgi:hypothetical protein
LEIKPDRIRDVLAGFLASDAQLDFAAAGESAFEAELIPDGFWNLIEPLL